ncbi:M48 family metalloprotease [Legionella yabuuchiae]|uniref:M48 family metalloprotease n=1 Tax=Legionella yabuuchiae TaxID=376727 RepID=UPI00105640A9|nr:M48 family metalloprotease [Legionella yabuuchiae]
MKRPFWFRIFSIARTIGIPIRKSLQFGLPILLSLSLFIPTALAYSPYTTRELDELEKEFVQQINQSNSVIRNPLATQYINHLGRLLAKHSRQSIPDFFIVKSKEVNAFAGPGGHIGINTQLILASDNVHELAAVMAHEMAHVRLHHLYRMIQHEKQMRIPLLASILASAALGILNPTLGSGALMASLSGVAQDSINYTRANEKEADRIGIGMLIKAGFDPAGMAGFFKKMQQNTRYYYTDHIPAILRTHPLDQDRIAEAENRSAQIARKTYTNPIDYYLFKELIRNLANDDAKPLLDFYNTQCETAAKKEACQYGLALTLIKNNQFNLAKETLIKLTLSLDNLYLQAAIAQAEIGQREFDQALKRLNELYDNYPDNYAALVLYAQGLIDSGNASKAAGLLLTGSREYKQDLTICHMLSQAQAASGQKDYAYFTLAQCELLQGRKRSAMQQLKTAKKLVKQDRFLKARISAKMEEIKFLAGS